MSEYHKIELEYILRCSPSVLYSFLTEPSGLSEWFCDNVNIKADILTLIWKKDSEQRAKKTGWRKNSYVRNRWLESPESVYLKFLIQVDEITGENHLMIKDFAGEVE